MKPAPELFKRLNVPLDRGISNNNTLYSIYWRERGSSSRGSGHVSCIYCSSNRTGHRDNGKSNTCIGHDVKCGPLCHFAMGSITGSLVVIGKCADVSIGATVLEKRKIGNFAMAGARSLLLMIYQTLKYM